MPPHSAGKFTPFHGILIKKTVFGEGHSFFTVLDRDMGKIRFLSFGSAGEKSERRCVLLVTNRVGGVLVRKADETAEPDYTLKEVSLVKAYPSLTGNLKKVSFCYLAFETTDMALSKDEPFGLFDLMAEAMDRAEESASDDTPKYFLHFLFSLFRSEGLLPETRDLSESLRASTPTNFVLGNGSTRFLEDVRNNKDMSYLSGKKLSASVTGNLLDLVRLLSRVHFGREPASLELIPK